VGAAVEAAGSLHAVADHPATAVLADGRHLVDGALEAVEHMDRTRGVDLEGLVVVVAAHLTSRHGHISLQDAPEWEEQSSVDLANATDHLVRSSAGSFPELSGLVGCPR
jgi:hypothetical protein